MKKQGSIAQPAIQKVHLTLISNFLLKTPQNSLLLS